MSLSFSLSFRKPQGATRTIELDEDTLVRKDGRTIVGLTLMNASTRQRPLRSRREAGAKSWKPAQLNTLTKIGLSWQFDL